MKKFSLAMLFAAVFFCASPVRAQYSVQDALNLIKVKMDSLATLQSGPTPVAVTSAFPIFSGIEMIAGTSSPTIFNTGRRTYPITGGMPLDGAKAVLLQFSWLKWVHGGFAFQPVYATTAVDSGAMSYSPTCYSLSGTASWADSIALDDSTSAAAGFVPVVNNGTATVRLPVPPGAGYLFVRMWAHADAGIHIHDLGLTARKVE
jgi:hypothetical protein